MNTETLEKDKTLTTADFAAAGQAEAPREADRVKDAERERAEERRDSSMHEPEEQLAPLFAGDVAGGFRSRWDAVQIGFVDDPKQAVRQADELVAQVMKSLAESFASERARIESRLEQADTASTEDMRMALRRYRSFFQRLLSL